VCVTNDLVFLSYNGRGRRPIPPPLHIPPIRKD
jgi:hypothetical protein